MSGFNDDRDRQVIPRWRNFDATLRRGELASHTTPSEPPFTEETVEALLDDWNQRPSLSVASDLVSVALTLDLRLAVDAAEFILSQPSAPSAARDLAAIYISEAHPTPDVSRAEGLSPRAIAGTGVTSQVDLKKHYANIHRIRKELEQYPWNPVLWCNLARLYTSLGVQEKASRSMRVAQSMAPNNRFVLRAASRLLLHQGEREQAHRLLANAESLKTDPWILAAEIATAAANNKTSKNIKYAQRFLELGGHSPFHVSELTSALGTIEMRAGKTRAGRRLILSSLQQPAENSIAQAAWLSRNVGLVLTTGESHTKSPEANAWAAWRGSDWDTALQETRGWQDDEPFSSRPAIFGSHVASVVLEDYKLAIQFTKQAISSNPDDATLHNNLAFALALNGNVPEAERVLQKAETLALNKTNSIALPATKGLVAYRTGRPLDGRLLYERAIVIAHSQPNYELESVALIYLALEELRIRSPQAEAIRKRAIDSAANLISPPYAALLERLKKYQPQG